LITEFFKIITILLSDSLRAIEFSTTVKFKVISNKVNIEYVIWLYKHVSS